MNEDQFLSVARKAAAGIKEKHALIFSLPLLMTWVDVYKNLILSYKHTEKVTIFSAYKAFCESGQFTKSDMDFIIVAYVELENQAERVNLIKKSDENAKDPQPLFKGGPKPGEL